MLRTNTSGQIAIGAGPGGTIDQGNTSNATVEEASGPAGPGNLVDGLPIMVLTPGGMPSSYFLSHARMSGGTNFVAMGRTNLAGPPNPPGLSWSQWQLFPGLRVGPSSPVALGSKERMVIDPSSLAANTVALFGGGGAPSGSYFFMLRTALPTGILLSDFNNGSIRLANITAGAIDSGPLTIDYWPFISLTRFLGSTRQGASGPVYRVVSVSVDHGSIPALELLSASVAAPGVNPEESFAMASPQSALPAGIAYSHCTTGDGVVNIFLGNLTGAPIDPPAIGWDVGYISRI